MIRTVAIALAVVAAPSAMASTLLPQPAAVTVADGALRLGAATTISASPRDPGARRAATALSGLLQQSAGITTRVIGKQGTIRFVRTTSGPAEGYRLTVGSSGATIAAHDDAGLFYGAVTMWQLATPNGRSAGPVTVPGTMIDDAPRFAWRGLMLDSARHFQSPAFIKQLLEWMSLNKLNRFHWHLVDDQGWRIPIDKYPRLTQIGGWRVPASTAPAPPLPKVGGVYTKAEIRDVVAFASARGIVVVPEIEMPGHALSAIRAYPRLGTGVTPPPGIGSDWGVFPYLYNVDEPTFTFLEDVLTEVMVLFPGTYIHVGGDEAVKDQWRASSAVQAKIKALGLANEEALQGWFVARIGKFLHAHGRKLVGWDEILLGGVPKDATVMSWQGTDGAIKAAATGHDTILAPAPTLYFDNIASTDVAVGRAHVISLADVYDFDPLPPAIPEAARHHVLGLQGALWTEHMRTEARVVEQAFPRVLAVAELGWSPSQRHDFSDFARRVGPQMARLGIAKGTLALPPTGPMSRGGTALATCQDKVVLGLEDDFPAAGPRATYRVDVLAPCWRWPKAPLPAARNIEVDVGQLPFNYQLGKDRELIRFRPPVTSVGELEVRDGCDGPLLAVLPLAPAAANAGVTTLTAPLPVRSSPADLCLTFTARGPEPIWAVAAIRLRP